MAAFTTIPSKTIGYDYCGSRAGRISRLCPAITRTTSRPVFVLPLETSVDGITPIREFEPVINVPAASAFLLIAVVFAILQLRINAVSNAAKKRLDSLDTLRKVQSLQLSDDSMKSPDEIDVSAAKREYEKALRQELDLRTIIPGVRIVAPNDPKSDEEQRAAAKRFLGWDASEFGDDNQAEGDSGLAGGSAEQTQLSGGAQVVLFGVASILIVLLWTLSFDPMSSITGL